MGRLTYLTLTVLSLVPPVVFVVAALFEPALYGFGLDRQQAAELGDAVRISTALLIVGMIIYFGVHLHRLNDPQMDKAKKSLWTWILILGNVFALPVVWYVFVQQRRGDGAS
jgi:hypothetical protein